MRWTRSRQPAPPSESWAGADGFLASRWGHLDVADRLRIIEVAHGLDERWSWEGLEGFEVTEDARAHVSTLASLLVLGTGARMLSDVRAVLIAPTSSQVATRFRLGNGLEAEGKACVLGSALLHGPVKLAWDRVLEERSHDSDTSVIIHEFAHKIDMADGEASGTPPITDRTQARAFERAAEDTLEGLRSEGSAILRPYAGTNRAELFAVASETLFSDPDGLASAHPSLFRVLEAFYRQTPRRSSGVELT